jgi:hypothetical protein
LRVAEEKTLWKADEKKLGARLARFAPDGEKLAWAVSGEDAGGGLMVADLAAGEVTTLWKAPAGGSVEYLAWSPKGHLAACVRVVEEDKVTRSIVLSAGGSSEAEGLPLTEGAYRLAWRGDGKALAFSTKAGLFLYEIQRLEARITLPVGKAIPLAEVPAEKAPPKGPAFEDLVFYGNGVAARRAGTMGYLLGFPDGKEVDLGECRGLCPDPERGRIYLVPWLAGPTRIPRGAGVAWIDPAAEKPVRKVIVPDRPAPVGGRPYWLVDVWDWHYPTTLRVSPDGKSVTFLGVRAGLPAENPWREFRAWRAPADGSAPPQPAAPAGAIPKRIDVGREYAIGWRYSIDQAVLFYDLAAGRAWRLPEKFYVQRANTDANVKELIVAGARGKDVVLFRLEE